MECCLCRRGGRGDEKLGSGGGESEGVGLLGVEMDGWGLVEQTERQRRCVGVVRQR